MTKVDKYIKEWQKSQDFLKGYIKDFKQLDTVANAQSNTNDSKNPNIGDTTVAGVVRQIPRTSIKAMPVFGVEINGTKNSVEALVCRHELKDSAFNEDTFGKSVLQQLQLGAKGALTRGFTPFQVATSKLFGSFGTNMRLVRFNDIGIEPGVPDAAYSSYSYVRTRMTPTKLKAIYENEKSNPDTSWNVKALKSLIDVGPDGTGSTDNSEYLTDQQNNAQSLDDDTYEIITRYEAKPFSDIVVLSPQISEALRVTKSRSKFGFPRVLFLVIDPSELSPFGDSRVRLASPNQNFLMALRQNVATSWMYNSKPTLLQTGNFMGNVELKNGGKIVSNDPNAKIQLLTLDGSSAQQYVNISDEVSKQILNMMGVNAATSLGAIGESKTGVGAKAQKATMDDATNQITIILEDFLRQYATVALDVCLSEKEGTEQVMVDDETKADIMRINPNAFNDPANPNALDITWEQLYDYIKKIKITIDISISKQEMDETKRADLQDMLTVKSQTSNPEDPEAQATIRAVEHELLEKTAPEIANSLSQQQQQMMPQQGLTQPQQL